MADYISTHTGTEIDTTLDEVANKINTTSIGVTVQGYNANTTTQGNTFNGISQLVQLDGTGKLPAVDGSLLTNLPSGGIGSFIGTTAGQYSIAISDDGSALALDDASDNESIAIGANCLAASTVGFRNIAIGWTAAPALGSGLGNVALGTYAMWVATATDYNVAIGYLSAGALTTGAKNTLVGRQSGRYITTGANNVGIGDEALQGSSVTKLTGSFNTGIGYQTGYNLTTGAYNVLNGYKAGNALTAASGNICIGHEAGATNVGARTIAIGYRAGNGVLSGGMEDNIFIGYQSGNGVMSGANADFNVGIGRDTLSSLTSTLGRNTALGMSAGANITTGSRNTCIGEGSSASSATVSDEITLGDAGVTKLRCAVTTITALSDERDKDNIQDLDAGLDFINTLRPVRFNWNMRDGGKVGENDIGFIAQELQQAQIDNGIEIPHLVMDNNPDKLEAGYGMLVAPMVKAIKELSAKVEAQQLEINTLKGL